MTDQLSVPALPTERDSPVHPPPRYAELREQAPISRHRWPNGVEAWLVTRYADVRTLLADERLSVVRSDASPPPMLAMARKPKFTLPRALS